MHPLIEKMRRARESVIEVGEYRLTVRRPTDLDAIDMRYDSKRAALFGVSEFIVDWSGITEIELVPGGTNDPVPFDNALFRDWIQDRPELWSLVIDGVLNAYKNYRSKKQVDSKN